MSAGNKSQRWWPLAESRYLWYPTRYWWHLLLNCWWWQQATYRQSWWLLAETGYWWYPTRCWWHLISASADGSRQFNYFLPFITTHSLSKTPLGVRSLSTYLLQCPCLGTRCKWLSSLPAMGKIVVDARSRTLVMMALKRQGLRAF